MKKYVDVDHSETLRKFEKEVNYVVKTSMESPTCKKRPNTSYSSIFDFFHLQRAFQKGWCGKIKFFGKSCTFDL